MAIFLNEDFENFMVHYAPEEMNEKGLRKQVQGYFRGQTKGIFFNVNAQRAYYDSKAYDPIWKNIIRKSDGKYYHRGKDAFSDCMPVLLNALHAKKLHHELGNKVFPIRIDECRKQGGKGCISVRMNDIHICNLPESPFHSDFWYEHPQWRLERYLEPDVEGMDGCGLDYAVTEVRDKVKELIAELFDLFDMDGMELDWMRTPPFLQEGSEEKNAHFLEEIVAFASEKRLEAEKRCLHKITLTVRVPSRPEDALALGLDVASWAKKRYVDMVVPCAFLLADGMIPLNVWKAILPESVDLVPGIDCLSTTWDGNKRIFNTAELVCGYAASFFHYGVKDIYLFNHMDSLTEVIEEESYWAMLSSAGEKVSAEKSFRRHLSTPCRNLVPGINAVSALPLSGTHSFQRLRMEVGENFAGREKTILMAFENRGEALQIEEVECVLNGVRCPSFPEKKKMPVLPENEWQIFCYAISEGCLQEGSNVVGFRLLREKKSALLQWCEIDIAQASDSQETEK